MANKVTEYRIVVIEQGGVENLIPAPYKPEWRKRCGTKKPRQYARVAKAGY